MRPIQKYISTLLRNKLVKSTLQCKSNLNKSNRLDFLNAELYFHVSLLICVEDELDVVKLTSWHVCWESSCWHGACCRRGTCALSSARASHCHVSSCARSGLIWWSSTGDRCHTGKVFLPCVLWCDSRICLQNEEKRKAMTQTETNVTVRYPDYSNSKKCIHFVIFFYNNKLNCSKFSSRTQLF